MTKPLEQGDQVRLIESQRPSSDLDEFLKQVMRDLYGTRFHNLPPDLVRDIARLGPQKIDTVKQ